MTNTQTTTFSKKTCHVGNTPLYTEPNGGTLFIGGWTTGAQFDWNTHVIDLTGSEHRYYDVAQAFDTESEKFLQFTGRGYAGWLSLPFPDCKTPPGLTTREQWEGIAGVIQGILKQGRDVLVACHGGHGRSGLFCAIVGFILARNTDRSWASPVEKIRKVHCPDAVETLTQEEFVYKILGLDIKVTRIYHDHMTPSSWTYEKCSLCGTQSTFVKTRGMCLGCSTKHEKAAPKILNMTPEHLKSRGLVDHECDHAKCIGIWKAQKCGHVVHDKIVYDGYCEECLGLDDDWKTKADKKGSEWTDDDLGECAICGEQTLTADVYGICHECGEECKQMGQVDYVHNTITDPYRAIAHKCNDDFCVGIVVADQCNHILHNKEVEDGLCPECFNNKKRQEAK